MSRLLRDGWFQVFLALSAFSALIGVFGRATRASGPAPSIGAVHAPPSAPTPIPAAAPVAAQAPTAAPGSPADPAADLQMPAPKQFGTLAPALAPAPAALAPSAAAPAAPAAPASSPALHGGPPMTPPPPQMDDEPAAPSQQPKAKISVSGPGVVPYAPGARPATLQSNTLSGLTQALQNLAQSTAKLVAARRPCATVTPKKAGTIVVGQASDPDADTSSLYDAVCSVRTGEIVELKKGDYEGPIVVDGREVTIRGKDFYPGSVIVRSPAPGPVVTATGGARLTLQNFRVERRDDGQYGPVKRAAVYAAGSVLELRNMELRAPQQGAVALLVEQGLLNSDIRIWRSELTGHYADAAIRGPASLYARDTAFLHSLQPIVMWRSVVGEFANCRFPTAPGGALYLYEDGKAIFQSGSPKPLVLTKREDSDINADMELFHDATHGTQTVWRRNILRPGRKPGTNP